MTSSFHQPIPNSSERSWRQDAVGIVEELFPVTSPGSWDLLLELRSGLLLGRDWDRTLDLFLACRETLEADHYLPIYRLRRLLAASLKLEASSEQGKLQTGSLENLLRRKHRTLEDLFRGLRRNWFEHQLEVAEPDQVGVRVIERLR